MIIMFSSEARSLTFPTIPNTVSLTDLKLLFLITIDNSVNSVHLISIKVIEDDALTFKQLKKEENLKMDSQNFPIQSLSCQTNKYHF